MNFSQASQGVENAKSFLRSYTQIDCIAVKERRSTITWQGRSPGVFKNVYYPLEYQYLVDNQQYSLLLSDSSFFQFYYLFDLEGLVSARLAYYPKPLSTGDSIETLVDAADRALDRSDDNLYEHLYNSVELLEIKGRAPSNSSHLRFDFDRKVTTHSQSHIQFSGVQEYRIPADCYPLPLAFVQACIPILPEGAVGEIGNLSFERNNMLKIDRPNSVIVLSG